ncbi:hypothetical protein An02g02070 [Aspergillus niger]|uniref:Uncharacterized protein n=2 Tax=Aspergillus niger TaxID=5061 RepID=A2QC28_ASPNC|nr:hypothetical protein An02g02070 [Aspergillus niger]CAK37509.1 hypothetical protein An02g02070 [Aspergillus niger]
MDVDILTLYGPGMSFYRSQIQLSSSKENGIVGRAKLSSLSAPVLMSTQRYTSALESLKASNQNLDYKMSTLRSNVFRLKSDLSKLQRHVKAFHNELLTTWQADTLTRLVEVVYERQNWKLPGGAAVGDHIHLSRERQSRILATAARRIRKPILRKNFGLSVQYYSALQRYDEVSGQSRRDLADRALMSADCPPAQYECFSDGMHICSKTSFRKGESLGHVSILGGAVSPML